MIVESAQLLSTAHRVLDGELMIDNTGARKKAIYRLPEARDSVLYKATHINHPSAIWVRESVENYNWLVDHFFALMAEYQHRYDKIHKCLKGDLAYMLQSPPENLKNWDMTPLRLAMPEEYIISDDPVTNYRNFYIHGKKHLHSWKNCNPPEWIA